MCRYLKLSSLYAYLNRHSSNLESYVKTSDISSSDSTYSKQTNGPGTSTLIVSKGCWWQQEGSLVRSVRES